MVDLGYKNLVEIHCIAKIGTVKWYHNSMIGFPISISEKLVLNVEPSNTGYYYCYGYDEYMSRTFLSQTMIQMLSKLQPKA